MRVFYVLCASHRLVVESTGSMEAALLFFSTLLNNNEGVVDFAPVTCVSETPFSSLRGLPEDGRLIPTGFLLDRLGIETDIKENQ